MKPYSLHSLNPSNHCWNRDSSSLRLPAKCRREALEWVHLMDSWYLVMCSTSFLPCTQTFFKGCPDSYTWIWLYNRITYFKKMLMPEKIDEWSPWSQQGEGHSRAFWSDTDGLYLDLAAWLYVCQSSRNVHKEEKILFTLCKSYFRKPDYKITLMPGLTSDEFNQKN